MALQRQHANFALHRDIAAQEPEALLDVQRRITTDRPRIDAFLTIRPSQLRFPSIVCYDSTRFTFPEDPDWFYHASWVDGYHMKGQYLLATAPHNAHRTRNFWKMAINARPKAIVLMDGAEDRGRSFIKPFWPAPSTQHNFTREDNVRYLEVVNRELLEEAVDGSYRKYRMNLVECSGQRVDVSETVLYVMRAEASDVPGYLPQLRTEIGRLKKRRPRKQYVPSNNKLLLVCADGVSKCSSYAVFDIVMDRLASVKKIGLKQTVEIVRRQRYGAVGTLEMYTQLHALIEPYVARAEA